jgi:transcriptional regulator with XRE-family HTH domain
MQEIHSLARLGECPTMAKAKNTTSDRIRKLFGEALKFVLEERGMSESALGREMKKSRSSKTYPQKTINNAVKGAVSIGLDNMGEMAEILGVPLWLFLVEGLPKSMLSQPNCTRLAKLVTNYAECDDAERTHIENVVAGYADLARKKKNR